MFGRACSVLAFAALACAGCGTKEKTTPELIADLKGGKERDRVMAVRTLPTDPETAAQVVPALIDALKDEDNDVRLSAAIKLGAGTFGERARDAVPALQAALKDPDARVRREARNALASIDPTQLPSPPKGSAPDPK